MAEQWQDKRTELCSHGEVDLHDTGLKISVQACLICGALVMISFDPPSVGIDNISKHQRWHEQGRVI